MNVRRVVGFGVCAAILSLPCQGAGLSMAASAVTITSPASGTVESEGFTGPVAIDVPSGSMIGDYTVAVTGPSGYSWQTVWNYDGSQETNSWSIDPTTADGAYNISVTAPDASLAAGATFTVQPPLRIDSAALNRSQFYPLERDGYLDSVRFTFQTNLKSDDRVVVRNHAGKAIRHVDLGQLTAGAAHTWLWKGKNDHNKKVDPGRFQIRVNAVRGGVTVHGTWLDVRVLAKPAEIIAASVKPAAFYPIEHDGYRDHTTFRFSTTFQATDTIRVSTKKGRLVRSVKLGLLLGHKTHAWQWGGRNNAGRMLSVGTYRMNVTTLRFGLKVVGHWHNVTIRRKSTGGGGGGGGGKCTPGYSPCLIYHDGKDYDCSGGTGNGPYFTAPGVVYRVNDSEDIYGLDADHDGYGCEQN